MNAESEILERTALDVTVTLRIAKHQQQAIKALAYVGQLSEADIIRAAIRYYLKAQAQDIAAARRELEVA